MKRNALIAQITLGTFICLATAQMSQAMQEKQYVILVSSDDRSFVLPQEVAFISDYVKALKTGGFLEATQEDPVELDIPGKELNILVQIMHILHENQPDTKAQATAVTRMPQVNRHNLGALIHYAQVLQLPESCIIGLIDRLAEFINQQKVATIPFDNRHLLRQLGRTYFLKYDQDLELADTDRNPVDIGFSIKELLDAGKTFPIRRIRHGQPECDLENRKINSLEGLLDIPGISSCRKIKFKKNQITSIEPGTFQGLKNLGFLLLDNNQITSIQPGTLQGLSSLIYLDLGYNQLTSIEPDTFQGLKNLKGLDLNNNQIATIQPNTFQGPRALQFLDLNGNKLTSIQPDTFQGLSRLTELYLAKNQLTSIEPGTFQGLTHLESLDLQDNRLSSDTIEIIREELPQTCKLKAENQRAKTPEERRKRPAAAGKRIRRRK